MTVLVVEDDALLGMELQLVLSDLGIAVVGPARSVAESLAALEEGSVDAAVLDANLDRESSEPVADRLAAIDVPFLYLSGHDPTGLPARHRHRPLVAKPFSEPELLDRIRSMVAATVG